MDTMNARQEFYSQVAKLVNDGYDPVVAQEMVMDFMSSENETK